jgi:hypothetical protein
VSRWFRHYAGMVRDDKLVRAALESRQSIERVVWVWGAVLESAAELDDGGRFEVDPREIAYFLRCKPAPIEAVLKALEGLGRIEGSIVSAWSRRQFKSDRSNERVAAHRNKKRDNGNTDVTLQVTLPKRYGNSPETETETDIPFSNENGAKADSDTRFWTDAKAYVGKASLVGKWVRDYGKTETARAITAAQIERAVDPVPYIEGYFRKHGGDAQPRVPL